MDIKSLVKKCTPTVIRDIRKGIKNLKRCNPDKSKLYLFFKGHIAFTHPSLSAPDDFTLQMKTLLPKVGIIQTCHNYIYPLDSMCVRVQRTGYQDLASVTVDYDKVLSSNIIEIEKYLSQCKNKTFSRRELDVLDSIKQLNDNIIVYLRKNTSKRNNQLMRYHEQMLFQAPRTLDEAIEKLLFYNAIFWQARHWHNGLGRLDMVLYPFYATDISTNKITRQSAKEMLKDMCSILGDNLCQKSAVLKGDTGQYILLGGVDKNGCCVQNELTEMFLEIFAEEKTPDPKLILRINEQTNDAVWEKAIKCISTGCGSPLLINEKLVMKGMQEFGYEKEDIWNFGTSACWEPLIIGKSLDQNNAFDNIPILQSLNNIILSSKQYSCFEDLYCDFKKEVALSIKKTIRDVKICPSPIYTLFFDDCMQRQIDFTEGGARYAFHGIQILSMPNTINALLNLKCFVFEKNLISMIDCKNALKYNFEGYKDVKEILLSNELRFGRNSNEVIELTNDLQNYISSEAEKYKVNGCKIKVGYSSSQFIVQRKNVTASFDGRNDYDPLAVHISPVSQKIDIQEVLDFASCIDYSGNKMNGNVVDIIIPNSLVQYPQKVIAMLKNALTGGVFELQANVVDVETLKDAKEHPEKYPNLIVRVWGFSAYFNDLPLEYKDLLIKRTASYAS